MTELNPSRDALDDADQRIGCVLEHPGMSGWLKGALRSALDGDPVHTLNDLEILKLLLRARTDALLSRHFDRSGSCLGSPDQWPRLSR